MPTFNTEAEILKYAQSMIQKSQKTQKSNVRKTVGDANTRAVESEVYAKYTPEQYDRRGRRGGLADERNVEVISVQSSGNTTQVTLENMTLGNDSMRGEKISDLIETGEGKWYNPNGAWSEPRPFVDVIVNELNSTDELRNALVKDLKNTGLDVV